MSKHNQQWEDLLKGYRKNKRLLVARNIDFRATRAAVEADIRAKLTKPDSVIFLWPPPYAANYSNPTRHMGWMMLSFSQRPDAKTAEEDLKNYEFLGRQVSIKRASRVAYAPSSSGIQTAAPTTATTTTTTTTTTFTITTTTTTTNAAATTTAPTIPAVAASVNLFDPLEETPLLSWDVLAPVRGEVLEDEDKN